MRSLLVVALCLTYFGEVISQCPDDWYDATSLNFGKNKFFIMFIQRIQTLIVGCIYLGDSAHQADMSFEEAYKFCYSLNANLIEVQSEQQLAFLDQILGRNIASLLKWNTMFCKCKYLCKA